MSTRSMARERRRRSRTRWTAAFFLLPFFALFFAFTIIPIVYSAVLSFFGEKASGLGLSGSETIFVGFDNFARALGNPDFIGGFLNVAVYCLIYVPAMIVLALVIALLLDSASARARSFFRVAFYMPNIVPGLIAAIVWLYLYTPGISPLVDVFEASGGMWDLTSRLAAFFSLANIAVWLHTGYNVILFYAALQSVPREVLEAASIDGAGPIRTSIAIKARMIGGAIMMAVLFTVIGALQLFAEPLAIRSQVTSIDSSWTPTLFIYQAAFERQDFGYAGAAAILFALFLGVMSWSVTRIQKKVTA